MAHEQLSAPRSQIDQDLKDLEDFPDVERFLFVRDLMHQHEKQSLAGTTKQSSQLNRVDGMGVQHFSYYDPETIPVLPTEMAEYVLPDTSSPLGNDPRPYDSLRELPKPAQDYYATGEHVLIRVGQHFMDRIPKHMHPYFYVTMSECSAIVAHSANDVYVAHLDFSRISQGKAVIQQLLNEGVDLDDIRIIGNTIGDDDAFDGEIYSYVPADKRFMTKDAFLDLGIPESNFVGFSDMMIDGNIRPITEVIVDKSGVFVDQAHYDSKSRRFDDDVLWAKYLPAT